MTKVLTVILNYNGVAYLPDCLYSLKNQKLSPEVQNEILIIDNNSADQSLFFLSQTFPEFKIIKNQKNLGFAKAANQGMAEATKGGYDYLFLLNQDTICENATINNLVTALEQNKNVAAGQPIILCWPEQDLIQTGGNFLHFLGFGVSGDYHKNINDFRVDKIKEIAYPSGAAMFLRVKAIKDIGLMDEKLFMYHEDIDWSWRARLLGYSLAVAPNTYIYHKYTFNKSRKKFYLMERNRLIVLLEFYRLRTLCLLFFPLLIMELGIIFYAAINGWIFDKIKSYFIVVLMLPKILKTRTAIQRSRRIGDRDVLKYMTGRIDFEGLKNPPGLKLANYFFATFFWLIKKLVNW